MVEGATTRDRDKRVNKYGRGGNKEGQGQGQVHRGTKSPMNIRIQNLPGRIKENERERNQRPWNAITQYIFKYR